MNRTTDLYVFIGCDICSSKSWKCAKKRCLQWWVIPPKLILLASDNAQDDLQEISMLNSRTVAIYAVTGLTHLITQKSCSCRPCRLWVLCTFLRVTNFQNFSTQNSEGRSLFQYKYTTGKLVGETRDCLLRPSFWSCYKGPRWLVHVVFAVRMPWLVLVVITMPYLHVNRDKLAESAPDLEIP